MSEPDFQALARQLMFELSPSELEECRASFALFEKQLAFLETIPTDDVEEMTYPQDTITSYLREDQVGEMLTVDEVLNNAANRTDDLLAVAKVSSR